MSAGISRGALVGKWMHSHEEDERGKAVFRTADYAFPRSRGRSGFELAADGSATITHPGPTDRRVTSAGKWSLGGNLLSIDAPDWSERYEIEELTHERFVARKR